MSKTTRPGPPPLIPRDVLFGNPVKAAPRLSPDGTRLAYLAPSADGVLNIWLRSAGQEDRQLSADQTRGIRVFAWAEDDRHILYQQDTGGDENWHVYLVDLETKEARNLTPYEGVRAQGLTTDKHFPDEIIVGLNLRDRSLFDMHRINLESGEVELAAENPGDVVGWVADAKFQIRAAVAQDLEEGGTILRVRDTVEDPWRELVTWPFGENGGPLAFNLEGDAIYCESSLGSNTTRLVLIDARSGEILREVAHDERCDIGNVMLHPDSRAPEAVSFEYEKEEWLVLDSGIKECFSHLASLAPGVFSVTSRDRLDKQWIVAYELDDGPVTWYRYERDTGQAEKLFVNRPELEQLTLAEMGALTIRARDGLQMVAYLTLPPGAKRERLPLVLNVHGGPWARNSWGFDAQAQWLANRGYATLQVNFRGSTGFGKHFINAGNRQWGLGAMQHDLSDAVAWAVEQGIADPERICIFGGSYGGYATLAGLAFTPELYACGVDIVGPSNLRTLFESIPPYWAPMKKELLLRVGEVETDPTLNEAISPLYHAEKIQVPLIIAQGANDPRVKIAEAEQMVEAMRKRGLEVSYVVYPDEGHGFARPENRLDFYGRIEEFLAQQLGGRAEAWTRIEGATAELR